MPSTYTLNNGITLIATGEQSGTWGSTTNVNLELVDTALDGQVTITLVSAGNSGAPNTLPISDGSASNGRNRMVIFDDGGDLGATAYVQLTPNDSEKIIYVRNALSGSRSILLFQGTYNASNDYEVPAGTTAVVYFNGAGTGAVAANVFNNAYFDSLRLGSVSVTAILDEDNMSSDSATALATQQSIKAYVDSQVGTVDTLAEILANGNTTGGTNIVVSSGDAITTNTISETTAASGVTIDSLLVKDGGITAAGTSTFAGQTITSLGAVTTADINGGTIDGTVIGGSSAAAGTFTTFTSTGIDDNASSTALTIDSSQNVGVGAAAPTEKLEVTGNLILDATDADIKLKSGITGTTGAVRWTFNTDSTSYADISLAYDTRATVGLLLHAQNGYPITIDGGNGVIFKEDTTTETMRIDTSGNVLIGTTSATTDLSYAPKLKLSGTGPALYLEETDTSQDYSVTALGGKFYIRDATAVVPRLTIDSSGNVGIGTSSPAYALEIKRASGSKLDVLTIENDVFPCIQIVDTGNWTSRIGVDGATGALVFENSTNNERMRIDSSGNVGIGTTSPSTPLTVAGKGTFSGAGSFEALELITSDTNRVYITGNSSVSGDMWRLGTSASNPNLNIDALRSNGEILFRTGGTNERMRITSTGDVSISGDLTGIRYFDVYNTASTSTDGAVIRLITEQVGSTATTSADILKRKNGEFRISNFDTDVAAYMAFNVGSSERLKIDSSGVVRPGTDNLQTLGAASFRWSVVYAGTGTINTSDAREKQQIADLDDAERRVAVALKGLVKKYKYNDAVELKGDDARIHVGVIAQEVIAAFAAEGLDATRYALLCYDVWDAEPEETDDEGNVSKPARDAGERYGIRYDELLAFMIAAL